MSTPYQSPIVNQDERTSLPLWENLIFAVVVIGATAYSVLAAIRLYTLDTIANYAKDIEAGKPPTPAQVDHIGNLDDHINSAFLGAFWAMYVVFIVWIYVLNARSRAAGSPRAIRKSPAWITWRVGVIVSLLVYIFVEQNNTDPTTLDETISDAHKAMAYMGVRLVIGLVYIWCAFSFHKIARGLKAGARTAVTTPPTGYPTGYPNMNPPYSPPQQPAVGGTQVPGSDSTPLG